jgi:hypothetical protein
MGDKPPSAALPARRRLFWLASTAVVLALVVTGGIWALTRSSPSLLSRQTSLPQSSSSGAVTSTATPTLRPARVVYTSNWSHGAGGWSLPSSVKVKSGVLVFSGNGNANLTIPYQPPVTGYSITVDMEIDGINAASNGGTVTIAGQDANGSTQLYGQIDCVGRQFPGCSGGEIAAGTKGGQFSNGMQVSDFDTGPYNNTYKVIVGASDVTFCFAQSCQVASYSNAPRTSLQLVLQDAYLQLKVYSVTVSIP